MSNDSGVSDFFQKFRFGAETDESAPASVPAPASRKRRARSASKPRKAARVGTKQIATARNPALDAPGQRVKTSDGLFEVSSFGAHIVADPPPHTLLLGSIPSITSHEHSQYYGFRNNAFWWIVGDAFGFRRGGPNVDEKWPHQWGHRKDAVTPLAVRRDIVDNILHKAAPVLTYAQQLAVLTDAGYCMWDAMRSCVIHNSDDTSIRDGNFNDVFGLLKRHPSIRRIVFCNGSTIATQFVRHHRAQLQQCSISIKTTATNTVGSPSKVAARFSRLIYGRKLSGMRPQRGRPLELCFPESVSPAAARLNYPAKRRSWFDLVFPTEVAQRQSSVNNEEDESVELAARPRSEDTKSLKKTLDGQTSQE